MTNGSKDTYDYLIIGAGPAGLQLGYYLEKARRSYLILEKGSSPGTFFKRFPRHRTLISVNKIFTGYDNPEVNMRFDWNSLLSSGYDHLFKEYSSKYFPVADDFVAYLGDYARKFKLKIRYNTEIRRVSRSEYFRLEDQQGNLLTSKRLVVATGVSKPYVPAIPGADLMEQYVDVSVNAAEFRNQKVLILGKGNSAFETADNLTGSAAVIHVASPQSVHFAWKTHFVGHLRAVNNNFLDTYQLKAQNAVLDGTIEKIERRGERLCAHVSYSHAAGEREELLYDRIICCTGFRFDGSIFDEGCRPDLVINERFPSQTSTWESTNVGGLYFAGTITQARDFKKTNSGFIHGFRYNAAALARILESRYHGVRWPRVAVPATPAAVASAMLARVNESSALWQQFGFIGDVVAVSKAAKTAYHYREVPVEYARQGELTTEQEYYVITLEFGHVDDDPFAIPRVPNPAAAEKSAFLHPVVRRYVGGRLESEHHVLEDLFGEWKKADVHVAPLTQYLAMGLGTKTPNPRRRREEGSRQSGGRRRPRASVSV
jgi:thioredoxin reductase